VLIPPLSACSYRRITLERRSRLRTAGSIAECIKLGHTRKGG
jgi:hypothetical protein